MSEIIGCVVSVTSLIVTIAIFFLGERKAKVNQTVVAYNEIRKAVHEKIYAKYGCEDDKSSIGLEKGIDPDGWDETKTALEKLEYFCACVNSGIYDLKTFKKIISQIYGVSTFKERTKVVINVAPCEEKYKNILETVGKM